MKRIEALTAWELVVIEEALATLTYVDPARIEALKAKLAMLAAPLRQKLKTTEGK